MNPFTSSLTRLGFLVWFVLLIPLYSVLLIISLSDSISSGVSLISWILLISIILMNLLIIIRRLQNAGLSIFLSLVFFLIPMAIIILFFLPPKAKNQKI